MDNEGASDLCRYLPILNNLKLHKICVRLLVVGWRSIKGTRIGIGDGGAFPFQPTLFSRNSPFSAGGAFSRAPSVLTVPRNAQPTFSFDYPLLLVRRFIDAGVVRRLFSSPHCFCPVLFPRPSPHGNLSPYTRGLLANLRGESIRTLSQDRRHLVRVVSASMCREVSTHLSGYR